MRSFAKNLALLMAGVIVALLLSELIVRIAAPQRVDTLRPIWQSDSNIVFRLKNNLAITYSQFEFEVAESTNSFGIRDRELSPKRTNEYRILGLGDSYSYANGVDLNDTYYKKLEKCLNQKEGNDVSVLNCAVPANTLLQEFGFLKKYGGQLAPDAVLLGFYVGNDFTDSYDLYDEDGKPRVRVEDGYIVSSKLADKQTGLRGFLFPIRMFLATKSHLYVFTRNRMSEFLAHIGLRSAPPPPEFCAKEFSDRVQKGWELDQRLLQEMSKFTRQHNLRLIVVVLPEIYQVHTEAWESYIRTFGIDSSLYDLDKPQRLVRTFCAENNIECLDVLSEMRSIAKTKQMIYPIDAHMNPEGHDLVARLLCEYVGRTSKGKDMITKYGIRSSP